MGIAPPSPQQPMSEDPDDFRPASSWRLVVDPDGHVDMWVIYESIGVGDKIPRHWHDVDEIIIERGEATVHVGGADLDVSDGSTVFVPAGTVHVHEHGGGFHAQIMSRPGRLMPSGDSGAELRVGTAQSRTGAMAPVWSRTRSKARTSCPTPSVRMPSYVASTARAGTWVRLRAALRCLPTPWLKLKPGG